MKNEKEVRELIERMVHKYQRMEKQKHTYGTKQELTQAEIHTIAYVGENPGVKQEALVQSKGITRGAASQMITKLVAKGLIDRRTSKNSNTEVALYLTKEGKLAFLGHQKYHEKEERNLHHTFQNFTEEEYDTFVKILKACDESLE